MGTSLNGLTPAGTYPGLIKTGDNAPIDGTLKTLSDGNGNNLPMSVSTTTINLTGTAQVGGVAIANTTQLAGKQDTLVSGTNIKTINGTSVLGSGDIVTPYTPPSGVAGAIQFSNGSAFASDASNLFWDDTNDRLGVGTNNPQTAGHFRTSGSTRGVLSIVNANDSTNYGARVQLYNKQSGDPVVDGANGLALIYTDSTATSFLWNYNNGPMLFGTAGVERMRLNNNGGLIIKGSGLTSATTSLLVENSGGSEAFRVYDDRSAVFSSSLSVPNATISTVAITCTSGVFAPSGGNGVKWGSNVYAISSTNGVLKLSDNSDADFNRLQFGGTTSSYPSLKRNGTAIDVRLADDSNYASFNTGATLIKGSGTTAATTSLLVQNSSSSQLLKVTDDGQMTVISSNSYADILLSNGSAANTGIKSAGYTVYLNSNASNVASWNYVTHLNASKLAVGGTVGSMTPHSSSVLDCQSTVGGFLPPRMTSTQRNAIADPV